MTDNRTLTEAIDIAIAAIDRAEISLGEARQAIEAARPVSPSWAEYVAAVAKFVPRPPQEPQDGKVEVPATTAPPLTARALLDRLWGRS